MEKIECKKCKYCALSNLQTNGSKLYTDYKCQYTATKKYAQIEDMVDDGARPFWCPLSNDKGQFNYADMSYVEKQRYWEEMPRVFPWEDIKAGEVYHVPAFGSQRRMDILVTTKYPSYLQYKEIDGKYNYVSTIYPSSILSKFIVPHHIKKFAQKK